MKVFFIGIAGGSGSGKTALAQQLKRYFKGRASIFHIDNYQRFDGKLPKLHGMDNWEHPKSVHWDKLIGDLRFLKQGRAIIVKSRDQERLKQVKEILLRPTEIIIVEGYLLFYNPKVRKLLDFSVFLEASDDTRVKRRTKFKNIAYIQRVLLPMHHKYIEPTRRFADLILSTDIYSIKKCTKQIIQRLSHSTK